MGCTLKSRKVIHLKADLEGEIRKIKNDASLNEETRQRN